MFLLPRFHNVMLFEDFEGKSPGVVVVDLNLKHTCKPIRSMSKKISYSELFMPLNYETGDYNLLVTEVKYI